MEMTYSLFATHYSALSPLRPEHALIAGQHGPDALVDELLQPFPLPGFGRVDVALGIGRDAVHSVELAGLTSAVAERGHLLERLAHDDAHPVVLTVGHEDETLLRVPRERDVPGRARAQRVPGKERFLHAGAARAEYLQAIIGAIAHVDQPIIRTLDAVHRVAELLRRRRLWIVVAELGVVRLVAVGAPVALHLAGIGVEHRHALVGVAVRDVGLVGLRIDPDLGDPAEVLEIVAAGVLAEPADLQQELAVLGELEDVRILLAVAADPNVAFVVDVDAVIGLRPFIARPWPAP